MASALAAPPALAQWPQWGGPSRNFTVDATGLAETWPENGPPRLWHRELGDGYSSVVVDDGMLFTLYRKEPAAAEEYVIALCAETGKTVWEYKYAAPVREQDVQHPGPHSTPLVIGDRLFAVGRNALLHCFEKKTGKLLWKQDLAAEFGAGVPNWGYASSPIAYENSVIVAINRLPEQPQQNGEGHESGDSRAENDESPVPYALVALGQDRGDTLWKIRGFDIGHSSPALLKIQGQHHLVLLAHGEAIGVDPADGKLLWQHAFSQNQGYVMTPILIGEDTLLCSAFEGSHALKLTEKDGKIMPEELWYDRKAILGQSTPVQSGDLVLGSRDGRVAFVVAIDVHTGKRLWIDRNFNWTTFLNLGDKLLLLDEEGRLALATPTADGLTIHTEYEIPEWRTYTCPTLAGTTLYLRDRRQIMALDLGARALARSD
ncbi:MAG: PQQ-like beta-propeller repeat protein [Phycisphaerales bacterium]|nr:MAG: PQQ-like beta-propeller repeat protein [Phycisphaerales bacterium]